METNFNEIKQEILRRAKEASACKSEYGRAYAAENLSELSEVIKDNFYWVCAHGVLTVDLIEKYKEDFAANGIYANQNVKRGYLICCNSTVEAYDSVTVWAYGSSTVKAYGNAAVWVRDNSTVVAYGNTTVEAYGNAMVTAYDNASVRACNNATVEAYDNAYCTSYYTIDCKLFDNAIYRVRDTNTIYYADSDIKFVKQ